MRLLLDTHIAIWWSLGDERLSLGGRSLIGDPANSIAISIVSLWEIGIKNALRRGSGIGLTVAQADALMREASFARVPVELRHILAVEQLPFHHRDPFDRMLVAQADADGYRLLTHDGALGAYGATVLTA